MLSDKLNTKVKVKWHISHKQPVSYLCTCAERENLAKSFLLKETT